MEPRRIMRRRGAAGFSHMVLLAGICALAISASPALAYWQDAGGALGGAPKTQNPKGGEVKKTGSVDKKGSVKKKDSTKKKDADQAKEDAIRSIDQLLGKPSAGTPGAKKGPIKPKSPVRRTSPKSAEVVPDPVETPEPPKEEEEIILPPAERRYAFAIKDGTFEQLLDAWSRQTGLGVIGKPPSGKVTFVSDETLSFREALNRIRTLLFKQEELAEQWLIYDEDEGFFEVKPVNEMRRYIPADRRFASIEAFLASGIDLEELVYVIYRPKRAVASLQNVMDHMPLYVLIAPYANSNTQTILALAKDVHKYLDLVDFLGGAPKDPRTIVRMKLEFVLPSVAIEKLRNLMDLEAAGFSSSKSPKRRGRAPKGSIVDIPEPVVSLLPDDALGVLLVRAMQDKIDEIELLLPYIDVDSAAGHPVVVVKVQHADVNALVGTIQTILQASASGDGASSRPGSTRKRTPKKGSRSGGSSSAPVRADDITLIPLPAMSQIIVLADEAGVERVRKLVKQFDVELDVRHRFALLHATPEEAIAQITALANLGDSGVQLIADPRGHALWYVGPASMLSKVEEVLPDVDVAGEVIELYRYRPVNQAPSFLANMLREYQNRRGDAKKPSKITKAGKRKNRGGRSATPVIPSRFTPDDDAGTLWVWCIQADWDEFLPLIKQLDEMAPEAPRIARIRPEHIDASEAIELLTQLAPMPDVVLLSTPDGILVSGATEAELADLNVIMEQIDRADDRVERTFTLQHADPAEMVTLLRGVAGGGGTSTSPRRVITKKGKKVGRKVASSSSGDLIMHTYGRQLLVSATPSVMAEVEKIIEQFDVQQIVTETRTYPFPPGTNLANVVGQLQGWLTVDRPKGASVPVMIPRQASRVLVVIAESNQFPKIEELIDVIDDEPDVPRRITDYIAVQHVSPSVLIEMIEPLLQISIANLVAEGVLVEWSESGPLDLLKRSKRRRPTPGGEAESTSGLLTMMPDERNHRIVIVAPEEIIAEARELVADFDLQGSGPVHKRIALRRAEAAAVVVAVKELMGQATGRKGRSGARRSTDGATSDESVSFIIVEAPGGGAVFVRGMPQDVEDAENWIDELDSEASGREIKLFNIVHADLKTLAEVIMTTVEAPKAQSPAARRGGRSARQEDSSDSLDMWETTFTKVGTDIYLKGDEIAGTLLAVASGAKMAQIEDIVLQFEGTDDAPPLIDTEPVSVPWMTYELQNVSALVGALNLDMYLDALWRPRDKLPRVDFSMFGEMLVIEYPDESRFDEIRQIIAEKIDMVDPDDLLPKTLNINLPKGIDPSQAALWLQMHYPDVQIEVEEVEREVDWEEFVPRVRPAPVKRVSSGCALPMSYQRAIDGLVMLAAVQDPPAEESDDAPASKTSESPRRDPPGSGLRNFIDPDRPRLSSQGGSKRTLRAIADPVRRTLSMRGQDRDIRKIEDLLDRMKEELGNAEESARPDIRVYRVRYISVYEAAEIIDEVFNATRREAQQLRQQQQAAARAAQQKANQARRAAQQKGGQPGSQPKVQPPTPNVPVPQMPQMPGGVRIVPNPRDRTLIMKANTSDYPAILELLATIDQPQPINKSHRTFQLERLNAEEVTAQLKEMLGLDVRVRKAKSSGAKSSGRSSSGVGSGLPETIMAQTVTGADELGLNAEDITLMANPAANTIFAMAPVAALDYIEQLIEAMDAHEAPERDTRHFELVYADAASTAEYLTSYFDPGKNGKRNASLSPFATPTFLPYPELNLVTVQAGEEQMAKVVELIDQVDVQRDSGQFESITVTTNAKSVADLLGQMYSGVGQRGKRGDGNAPTFIGEEGGSILFYSAPEALHEEILTRIREIEEQADVRTKPRIIELKFAKASDLATAIEGAYGAGDRGRRGKSTSLFTITPHDASKRLFVTGADDAVFEEVKSLAELLDKPADMGFEFRIYPFQHVKARKVHELLTKLVREYIIRSRGGAGIEPFSAEVDDKSNALVVMGSPNIHEFLSKNIAIMDNPLNAESPPGFFMVALKNADAAEVAGNINRLWGEKQIPAGEKPPQAEANRTLNVLVVKGTQEQIDEIKTQFIDPIEENKVGSLVHPYKLELADATEVAKALNAVYNSGRRRGGKDQRVQIIADPSSNQIFVLANEAEYEEVAGLIKTLDVKPESAKQRKMRSFKLRYSDTWGTTNAINMMFRSFSRNPKDRVVAVPEWGSNSVIVSASEEKMEKVASLIEQLDSEGDSQRAVEIIPIKHAEPSSVARALDVIYIRSAPRQRSGIQPIAISEVPGSKAIMVKANEEDMARIRETITSLDTETEEMGGEIRVIPLLKSDVSEVLAVMQEFLRKPGGSRGGRRGRGGADLMGDVRLSALTDGNAIVVSGDVDAVNRIEAIIKSIDDEGEMGRAPKVIRLEHADAVQLLPTLEQMFGQQQRRGARGRGASQQPPVIVANETLNALLVRAGAADFNAIQDIVKLLDTEEAGMGSPIKIISVAAGVNVADLASMLETQINATIDSRGSGGGRGGRSRERISITADQRTHSILVAGASAYFNEVERLVRELEKTGPTGQKHTAIIRTVNLKAEEVRDLIERLKEENQGSSGSSRGSSRRGSRRRR